MTAIPTTAKLDNMTTNPVLTEELATRLLNEVVDEYGDDFVYSCPLDEEGESIGSCVYTWNEHPSCLVGHVLFRAGISVPVSRQEVEVKHLPIEWFESRELVAALQAAQELQDDNGSWGDARAAYLETLRFLTEEEQ